MERIVMVSKFGFVTLDVGESASEQKILSLAKELGEEAVSWSTDIDYLNVVGNEE